MPPERQGLWHEPGAWFGPALLAVGLLTGFRILCLAFTPMDLFVDEAQYWLWGQELAFGYYSKPPLVGWVIRALTEIGGDGRFWVRLPGPLLHAATALILGAIAARLWGARAALFSALAYATLPMVALASILISTDTVMFPFLGLALLCWLRVCDDRGRVGMALLAGICLGLAMLAKYAAIYFLLGAPIAAMISPALRPGGRAVLLALLGFALILAPNVWWNVENGFSTVEHTLDNADWVRDPSDRAHLNIAGALGFLAAQFGVFGPVMFGGLVALAVSVLRGQSGAPWRWLLAFVLPALAVVTAQALISRAYANWAASAYLAGTVAVMPWLLARARAWAAISLAINGLLAIALPVASLFADSLTLDGRLVFERYIGRAQLSREIMDAARAQGLPTVVAEDRDILADLFYTGRDSGLTFRAMPETGRPSSHYALKFPLEPGGTGEVLFVSRSGAAPACAPGDAPMRVIAPERGEWAGRQIRLWRLPATCWDR